MLWNISWRNVWRNKKRSAIIIFAITFGLWAGIVTMGFYGGMLEQIVESAIDTRVAHIQIHAPGFRAHKEVAKVIPNASQAIEIAKKIPDVKFVSGRSIVAGMASSAVTGSGVEIFGIVPDDERNISEIYNLIEEGTYFDTKKRNPAVIGRKLAQKLEVKVGNKIVLTAQGRGGDIDAGAFKVVGIYKTVATTFDEATVFARQEDVDRIFRLEGGIHEIAVMTDDVLLADSLKPKLVEALPDLEVSRWSDIAPDLAMMTEATQQMLYVFMIIILLALVFGITNTMLMSVLERVREIGVVMALGMKHLKIFAMIVIETICLSMIGGVLGIIAGAVTMKLMAHTGIDLSVVSEGLNEWGMSEYVYPVLAAAEYPRIAIMVIVTAVIASIYPAIKAVRLNPVEAIRTY